jgi:hypothetical protein
MPKYKHGSGSIYKRGKTWWLTFYVNGQQQWESAKTTDKATARQKLQEIIGQRAEGRLVIGGDKITFEALIQMVKDEYGTNARKSADKVQYRERHLAKSFAGWKARDITVTDLRAFISRRQEEGAANAEINRELATLRRGFNLALQAERIPCMPHFPRLQESAPRAGFFEAHEFHDVLHRLRSV